MEKDKMVESMPGPGCTMISILFKISQIWKAKHIGMPYRSTGYRGGRQGTGFKPAELHSCCGESSLPGSAQWKDRVAGVKQ